MSVEVGDARKFDQEPSGITRVRLDPQDLMDRDRAFKIIDTTRTLIGGGFLPEYYSASLAQVLLVYDPHTGKPRYRAKDGHHRIAAAGDYMLTHPDYILEGNDVTKITLKNNYPKRQADYLTEDQFYREIGEPTKAHGEIQFRRIASHLISDWRGWVGDDIAENFSGLAALFALGRKTYRMQTLEETVAHQAIDASEMAIMENEDEETRKKLKLGLKQMASRIFVTGLGYDEIALAGFQVATGSYEDIGEEARVKEIRGLVSLSDVAGRFSIEKYEQEHTQLSDLLIGSLQSIIASTDEEKDTRGREIRAIMNALSNTTLSFGATKDILDTSKDGTISGRYKEILLRKRIPRIAPSQPSSEREGSSIPDSASPEVRDYSPNSETRDSNLNNTVIVTAADLRKALERFSGDPTKLNKNARYEVDRVLRLASSLGLFEDESVAQPVTSRSAPISEASTSDGDRTERILDQRIVQQILSSIAERAKSVTSNGGSVPVYIKEFPRQVFVEGWEAYAACKDDPEAMNVRGAKQQEVAVKTCQGCQVQQSCLAHELTRGKDTQVFVRGGRTADERKDLLHYNATGVKIIIKNVAEAGEYQAQWLK